MNCCIAGCYEPRTPGSKTCVKIEHRSAATARAERGRKKPRKRRENAEEVETSPSKPKKPPKLQGVFNRKWTHNEQLMVRPCGIVIGRATFYRSESVTGVKVRM